jgi:hypothetical protein
VSNFNSANYDLIFDTAVLSVSDVTNGLIGGTMVPVDMWEITTPGTIRVINNVPGLSGLSGSGYLAEVHFHVISSGTAPSMIGFVTGVLSDSSANVIPATWVADYVTLYKPGDANGDGIVNCLDLTTIKMVIMILHTRTPGCDANLDGTVDALDITRAEMIIIGS